MRLFFLIIFILSFSSCTSKNISNNLINKQNIEINDDFDDDFSDEFEENEEEIIDPLSSYNKVMTSFNDKLYTYALIPTSKAYKYVLHEEIRISISNFFKNIFYPIRAVNNLLQLKFKNTAEESGRFLINTTIGIFGLFDPASSFFNLKAHKEDFGQTLGFWGVGPGFHIVLPFLGPSNLRDSFSLIADGYLDPTFSLEKKSWKLPNNLNDSIGLTTLYYINKASLNVGQYENLKKDAIELYPFLRDIYEQKREHDIKE